jgi:hypothetical protein
MTPLFVPLSSKAVAAPSPGTSSPRNWTLFSAETLLSALPGVITARVVGESGRSIEEIHLLTTQEALPARSVRDAEAALRLRFGLSVDPRLISITQTGEEGPTRTPASPAPAPAPVVEPRRSPSNGEIALVPTRIRFVGLRTESRRSSQVSLHVELEWLVRRQHGEAMGADVPRAKMETAALATLRAIELVAGYNGNASPPAEPHLSLLGVQVVDAFEGQYVLAAVHAMEGRRARPLSGSSLIEDSPLGATVLATLKATDRWMRGRARVIDGVAPTPVSAEEA